MCIYFFLGVFPVVEMKKKCVKKKTKKKKEKVKERVGYCPTMS